MNLFEFFRDAALCYLRDVLGIATMDESLERRLRRELSILRRAYGSGESVDYQDPFRKVAYLLHYAPKHAVIWREYSRWAGDSAEGDLRINSVGTGPGSELIGLFEGLAWKNPGTIEVACLETEKGWYDVLQCVFDTYEERRGIEVTGKFVSSPEELMPQQPLYGSFVLSDMGRSGILRKVTSLVPKSHRPLLGTFLDSPAFTDPDDGPRRITDVISVAFTHLPTHGFECMDVVNAEMEGCDPIFCKARLDRKPNMNMFWISYK